MIQGVNIQRATAWSKAGGLIGGGAAAAICLAADAGTGGVDETVSAIAKIAERGTGPRAERFKCVLC
jgi:hypothetical protein